MSQVKYDAVVVKSQFNVPQKFLTQQQAKFIVEYISESYKEK